MVGFLVSLNLASAKDFRGLSWPVLVIQFASIAGPLAVLIPALPALAKRSLRELGLHPPRGSDIPWALGGAAGMFIVATAIGAFQDAAFHLKADQVRSTGCATSTPRWWRGWSFSPASARRSSRN